MKENKCDGTCADNECICNDLPEGFIKTYTIEEIERAIDKSGGLTVDKQEILNNLKK